MHKTLFVILSVLLLSSSFFSCKKSYICVCVDRSIILTNSKDIKVKNWSDAKYDCEKDNPPDPNGTTGIYCELQPE